MYLVKILLDSGDRDIFVTSDRRKASKWVDKYNNIISQNIDRIYKIDLECCQRRPFMYDYIIFEPYAALCEVDLRG